MPYMTNGKRDYKKENAKYNSKPSIKKARAQRNAARAMMIAAGKAAKGDGKDVGHRQAISKGGTNSLSNLFSQNASENRSFRKNSDSSMKSEKSKRESRGKKTR